MCLGVFLGRSPTLTKAVQIWKSKILLAASLHVYHWIIGSQYYKPPDEWSVSFKKHALVWSPPSRKGWGDEQACFASEVICLHHSVRRQASGSAQTGSRQTTLLVRQIKACSWSPFWNYIQIFSINMRHINVPTPNLKATKRGQGKAAHTHTHTHTHTNIGFPCFTGFFHRHNYFYTVKTAYSIP